MPLQQTIAALRFSPLLPVWLIVLLGALCVVALIPAFWRRAPGAALRACGFGLLLLWLTGPMLVQESRLGLSDIGLLVVDQSASMQIGDRARLTEAARAGIVDQAGKLPGLELRTVTVPEGGNTGTNLFNAIGRALADIPRSRFAGTVMITDGQVHDIPDAEQASRLLGGTPLNVLVPAAGEETDRRLRVIEAPSYGVVGKPVTLRVIVEDLGAHPGIPPGTPVRLTLRRDGEPAETRDVPSGIAQTIEIPITRAGPTVIGLTAETLPGEVSTLNNRAVVEINGVRDRLRVLLISGEPHSGERTWRRLLKADPAVDLVHFTILRPPEKDDQTPLNELALIAFPVRELFLDKLDSFDLIVLDRFQNRGLLPMLYLGYIADHVRAGGALLLSVGPEFAGTASLASTPLGSVLPAAPAPADGVVNGAFRPVVTELGARHPVTESLAGANIRDLSGSIPGWGSWYRHIAPAVVRGDVLMSTPDGAPLLITERYGKGRAALLLSDQIWLWSRGHQGGGPQAELLRRIAHWLMQEPELEENALTARVADARLHVERRTTDPGAPETVTVTDPEGRRTSLALGATAPGRAAASLSARQPGIWQVSDGIRTAYAASGAANPPELADLRATATLLSPLARGSGGGVRWIDGGPAPAIPSLRSTEIGRAASGSTWIGLAARHDHIVTGIAGLALLPAWLALPMMLGVLLAAWRREGA